ncbi:MAG TPA: hypothetical protein VFP65_12395 [Anaeromyxobacteraceae bacterium]|nr:hypothetical protein [Anaeromyxobacteraceae bacterium]
MIPPPELIVADLRREARWRRIASMGAIAVAFPALVIAAHHVSTSPKDRVIALALGVAGLACASASASRRSTLAVAIGAPSLLLATALAAAGGGALAAALGIECLVSELVVGAVVVAATWFAIRGGTTVLGARAAAAGAASGALAGAAALQLTCPAHDALGHLLAFHVVGVALAAGVAAVCARQPAARDDPGGTPRRQKMHARSGG